MRPSATKRLRLKVKTNLNYRTFTEGKDGTRLFDPDMLRITEEDAQEALSLTPNLQNKDWFEVGNRWQFHSHQLRRTLAVNMFASDVVSVSSIQQQMKHLSQKMTLYYGRHHTNLRLNSEAEKAIILESHADVYQNVMEAVRNNGVNVKPHGEIPGFDRIADLIEAGEEKELMKLIRDGSLGVRRTLLGFCMKAGPCEYGGIESVAKCAGGDGGGGLCRRHIQPCKQRQAAEAP